jgi:hypothetical protein
MTSDGACVFYDTAAQAGRCSLQRALGHASIPSSCRHFPRVCLEDARGLSVTLSHYCPTAAGMLFRDDRVLEIVAGPEPVPGERPEGLDARRALPPLLTPSVLMDHAAYAAWERFAVAAFAQDGASPEDALARLALAAGRLRAWRPGGAPLAAAVAELGREASPPRARQSAPAPDVTLFDEVRRCVPAPWTWDPAPEPCGAAWERLAARAWRDLRRPVRFFLAAKAFASWSAYQGEGLRSVVRSLEAALSVVKVEALRLAVREDRVLDAQLLREAFRRADLLLVHLAERAAVARAWSRAERTAGHGVR